MVNENELMDMAYEAVEIAKKSGKVRKGTNEVTKAVEKGTAKLVVVAKDVNPPEIIMHLKTLCKEKGILYVQAGGKDDLGAAAGLPVGTSTVAVVQEGEGSTLLKKLAKELAEEEAPKEEKKEKPKEEAKEEPKEEKKKKAKEEPKEKPNEEPKEEPKEE